MALQGDGINLENDFKSCIFYVKSAPLRLTIWGVSAIIFLMCDFAQKWKEPQCGVFI